MLVTWLVIVPIAREAATGATVATVAALVVLHAILVLLALAMPWIERWRYVSPFYSKVRLNL
jgi:hypothetical protein